MITFLSFINLLLGIYFIIIIINVVFSWLVAFNIVNLHNRFIAIIAEILYRLTEPVFRPIRSLLPRTGSLDFSPMVVMLMIIILQSVIDNLIRSSLY